MNRGTQLDNISQQHVSWQPHERYWISYS